MKVKVAVILLQLVSLACPILAKSNEDKNGWGYADYACVGVGAGVAIAGAPIVISAAGFGEAGIAAGSWAASAMSASASYGVGAGAVGALQSVGAAGLGAAGTVIVGGAGGVAAKKLKDATTED